MRYIASVLVLAALLLASAMPAYAAAPEPETPVADVVEELQQSEFLHKPFEAYTVTEGFCLIFLLLAYCASLWIIVRGVFRWV